MSGRGPKGILAQDFHVALVARDWTTLSSRANDLILGKTASPQRSFPSNEPTYQSQISGEQVMVPEELPGVARCACHQRENRGLAQLFVARDSGGAHRGRVVRLSRVDRCNACSIRISIG